MPIRCSLPMRVVEQDEFHKVDREVMRIVFDIHNTLGRTFDEKVYQNELWYRCRQEGITASTESCVHVSYESFQKDYYLDLVIDNSIIYELKTTDALVPAHKRQAINYLALTGLQHGKLINFRPASVESKFVSTRLTPAARGEYNIVRNGWNCDSPVGNRLVDILDELLDDWGVFLEADLYLDAMIHFLGGEEKVRRPVDVICNGRFLGHQKMPLLDDDIAFYVSAVTRNKNYYKTHLQRRVRNLKLRALQWINFEKHNIVLKTVEAAE